jgi:flagellar biogenesis protein FliO
VLAGMLLVFYFMKRFLKRDFSGSKENLIRVLASSYIGVKKHISLVEVPGSVLVVGITNDKISLLGKIEDKELLDKLKLSEEDRNQTSFSEHLQRLSSRLKTRDK